MLKDDGRIRVIDYAPNAGDKLPMHSHPTMVVYSIKGGETKFTLEDGRTTERLAVVCVRCDGGYPRIFVRQVSIFGGTGRTSRD